jgi:hypothetical protein
LPQNHPSRAESPWLVAAWFSRYVVSAVQSNPSLMAVAVSAVLRGIVAAGSNRTTAKERNGRQFVYKCSGKIRLLMRLARADKQIPKMRLKMRLAEADK